MYMCVLCIGMRWCYIKHIDMLYTHTYVLLCRHKKYYMWSLNRNWAYDGQFSLNRPIRGGGNVRWENVRMLFLLSSAGKYKNWWNAGFPIWSTTWSHLDFVHPVYIFKCLSGFNANFARRSIAVLSWWSVCGIIIANNSRSLLCLHFTRNFKIEYEHLEHNTTNWRSL